MADAQAGGISPNIVVYLKQEPQRMLIQSLKKAALIVSSPGDVDFVRLMAFF